MIVQVLAGESFNRETSAQQIQELYSYLGGTLYGFCNGHFGRNSYGKKKIVGIGALWVVVNEREWDMEENGEVFNLAGFDSTEEMLNLLKQWSDPSLNIVA